MKKFFYLILIFLILVSLFSCGESERGGTDILTTALPGTSVTETASSVTEPYVNVPNEQGIIRVDGLILHSAHRFHNRQEDIPYYPTIKGYCRLPDEKDFLIVTEYNTLKSIFDNVKSTGGETYKTEDFFEENIFEENIIVILAGITETQYRSNFAWFDCRFTESANELSITPVRKKHIDNVLTLGFDIVLSSTDYFVTIPRSLFPDNYDVTALTPVLEETIKVEDSSMPNPWEAGGTITAVIELNLEDNYGDLREKYREGKFGPIDFEKVQAEIYGENIEYLKNINLTCPNVIVSKVSRFVYVHFDNRVEFMKYKDYFDALASSEYVKYITIT